MFKFVVYTVSSFRIVGHSEALGNSAAEVGEAFLSRGYVKVEVAPAAPVNGYPNNVAGVDYISGDTFSRDTRSK